VRDGFRQHAALSPRPLAGAAPSAFAIAAVRRVAAALAVAVALAGTATWAAIPIQPLEGPQAGCSPPGDGSCAEAPGAWIGTAGNDTVQAWISADRAGVERIRVVVHDTPCVASGRLELSEQWNPGKPIVGTGLPECVIVASVPCALPATLGWTLTIRFRTSSCALADLQVFDPTGRGYCPLPCVALDDIGVDVAPRLWGHVKQLYR
jgi:hypothetical protein